MRTEHSESESWPGRKGVTYWGRSEPPPSRSRTPAGRLAWETAAGVLAIVTGIWAALAEPALGLFEQTMRVLGIVGGILSALWLLHTILVVFIVMLVTVFTVSLAAGLLERAACWLRSLGVAAGQR